MNIHTFLTGKMLRSLGLGLFCTLGAFVMGIETAGDVHPFERSQAALTNEQRIRCDIDGNGIITASDVEVPLSALPTN